MPCRGGKPSCMVACILTACVSVILLSVLTPSSTIESAPADEAVPPHSVSLQRVSSHVSSGLLVVMHVSKPPAAPAPPTAGSPRPNTFDDDLDELKRMFTIHTKVDYNSGTAYDIGFLVRAPATRTSLPSTRGHNETSPQESTSSIASQEELLSDFLVRCQRRCLALGNGSLCTGFVHDTHHCTFKRFMASHRLPREDMESYIRDMSRAPPQFIDSNYRMEGSSAFRRNVGFGVLATSQHLHSRLVPMLSTWLCHMDALLLFEDDRESVAAASALFPDDDSARRMMEKHEADDAKKRRFWSTRKVTETRNRTERGQSSTLLMIPKECQQGKIVRFASPPEDAHLKSFNGAWKNFPLLQHLNRCQKFVAKRWTMVVDDDTFVITHSLNLLITNVYERLYNPLVRGVLIGAIFKVGGTRSELFVQGGAGILMTRAAVSMMARSVEPKNVSERAAVTPVHAPYVPLCHEWCQQWAGDIRMGCCAKILKMLSKHDFTFWSEDMLVSLGEAKRPTFSLFPTTTHQMKDKRLVMATHNATLWAQSVSLPIPIK